MSEPCAVLVVEDEPLIREVFESVLTAEGCAVSMASDGASMRKACASGRFDVVVMDIALPGGESGLEIAHEAAAGCGVILITGHHSHYDAVARSGYRYLFKPFRVEALVRIVHELLEAANASCTMKGRRAP